MKTIYISNEYGTDISSRTEASRLRNEVIKIACGPEAIARLDFGNVRTLSDSFADELFGVLVAQRGEGWFKSHVQVVNLSRIARQTILDAVQGRLHA